jgi:hypothetical protein
MTETLEPPKKAVSRDFVLRTHYTSVLADRENGGMRTLLRRSSLVALGIVIGLLIAAMSGSARSIADLFGPAMVRAQAVVLNNGHDDVVYVDRGRIVTVGPSNIVVRERDQTLVPINVDPAAKITLAGVPVQLQALRRGMHVQAFRLNDNPADRLEVTLR